MGYKNKIVIDYEGLPNYVVKEIQYRFDDGGMGISSDFKVWQNKILNFLATIPSEYWVLFLKKGLEFAEKALAYHSQHDCHNKNNCRLNETWERQIALTKQMLKEAELPATENAPASNIKFAGSKIDLIRVLNALYELKKIEGLNGQVPPKKEFMIAAGQFFNINLSDYDTSLSQAIKEGELEPNIEIFEKMKTAIQNIWHERH
ncbi:MAG TPA: hypothetical protein VEC12_15490 [Bacteroidia bacterium]|nr:hypothetical protein [Bacteroidia bacterium]